MRLELWPATSKLQSEIYGDVNDILNANASRMQILTSKMVSVSIARRMSRIGLSQRKYTASIKYWSWNVSGLIGADSLIAKCRKLYGAKSNEIGRSGLACC